MHYICRFDIDITSLEIGKGEIDDGLTFCKRKKCLNHDMESPVETRGVMETDCSIKDPSSILDQVIIMNDVK
jgi:hypothetical protein